jgi:hypothetical protein
VAEGQELTLFEKQHPQLLSPQERLTRQFYAWEMRGRGWQVWPYPVILEPPFRPFFRYLLPTPSPVDDGKRPTFLSSLIDSFRGKQRAPALPQASQGYEEDEEIIEAEADVWSDEDRVIEIHVTLPPKVTVAKDTAEQFLLSLSYCAKPVSFEVIGTTESVVVQLTCFEQDKGQVWQQLQAYFPEAVLTEETGFLEMLWNEEREARQETVVVDFGLSNEFMLPLKAVKGFDPDPLIGFIGSLSTLSPGEIGVFQVLFEAVRYPWHESIIRAVTDYEGGSFFADSPDLVPLSRHKIARPLFACVVRIAARSRNHRRSWQIAKSLGSSLTQFGSPTSNELLALANDDYEVIDHEIDVLARQTHRSGMLLNTEELVSLVHLPSSSVRSEKLKRHAKKTKAAPAIASGHSLVLGENRHGGITREVTLYPEQRTRHMYVIGASGTGKSTLLLNLIAQDIEQGQGVAVLDPHGDLIDHVIARIPESRFDDVILFDPSDDEYPIGFNILSTHSELEKTLLESDLVGVFRRLSTSWGDQMNSVLSNAILAFLESSQGGTLADMRRFLVEPEFRYRFLESVTDRDVVYYWVKEFPLLTGRPQAPLLTRLDTFLRPKPIRYMVAQKENRIDFAEVMNKGKIFLAKLSQGAIGEENSYLLGSLLVSKFHQMALSRQEVSHAARRPFWLYIDEFQNFVTPSMASILSGARKYRLGLILAHQELRQLLSKDTEVASAVITNPYTRICFRMGDDDAKKLSEGFAHFDATDLQNLSVGEAICRMERAEYDFNLHTRGLSGVDEEQAEKAQAEVLSGSRQKYGKPRSEVEAALIREQPHVAIPVAKEERPKAPSRRERVQTQEEPKAANFVPPPAAVIEPQEPIEPPTAIETREFAPESVVAREIKRTARSKAKGAVMEAVQPGKGGQQHKYLQQLIKRWGEERGYKSTIEKQIVGGSVDVALEKDGQTIACEISVTTTVEHEVGNIKKCLNAGLAQVIIVTSDKKVLGKIREAAIFGLGEERISNVQFFLPEDLFVYLDQIAAESKTKEEVVKGYKVKVKYKSLTPEEQKGRKEAIAKTVLQAMKRLQDKG